MLINEIRWISEPAEEAEVEIVDGNISFWVFSHPCKEKVGQRFSGELHVFSIKYAYLFNGTDEDVGIWPVGMTFKRKIIAKVLGEERDRLQIGNIELMLDEELPAGINNGDYVEIECARIDTW